MGQYLQVVHLLQGIHSTLLFLEVEVLVDALTNWSDKLLFHRWPETERASVRVPVRLQTAGHLLLYCLGTPAV